ncbi:TPA: hypothetical protein OME01_005228, partial [Klebsiella pneumoniae]|nr:hypothetical protein [Klebsiella pneumoniae]
SIISSINSYSPFPLPPSQKIKNLFAIEKPDPDLFFIYRSETINIIKNIIRNDILFSNKSDKEGTSESNDGIIDYPLEGL